MIEEYPLAVFMNFDFNVDSAFNEATNNWGFIVIKDMFIMDLFFYLCRRFFFFKCLINLPIEIISLL